ncbi:unnamed protein product [Mytilus edulis]|uniref:Uncharacterized protein n=1 Tax=Mytilus edulis TaxID=6550 RepID=A0A8S3TDE8_MYTED|nr:unnamed protein product [Mytilus edulis]
MVPYYCTLCLFRCGKESDMLKHGQHFRPHQIQKEEMINRGQYQEDRAYIKRSPLPYRSVIGLDLEKMTRIESLTRTGPRAANGYTPTFGPTSVVQQAEVVEVVEVVETEHQVEVVEAVHPAEVVEEVQEPEGTPLPSPVSRIFTREKELEEEQQPDEFVFDQTNTTSTTTQPAEEWNMNPTSNSGLKSKSSSSSSSSSACSHKVLLEKLTEQSTSLTNTKAFPMSSHYVQGRHFDVSAQ